MRMQGESVYRSKGISRPILFSALIPLWFIALMRDDLLLMVLGGSMLFITALSFVHYFKTKYTLKENILLVEQWSRQTEIEYSSIVRVTEYKAMKIVKELPDDGDTRSNVKNVSLNMRDSILILYGADKGVLISPAMKQEFLLDLEARIPDSVEYVKNVVNG